MPNIENMLNRVFLCLVKLKPFWFVSSFILAVRIDNLNKNNMEVNMVNINLHAKSTFPILAVAVFVVLSIGTAQNNADLLQLGNDLFMAVLVGVIAVTLIRSDSKSSR